MKDYLTKKQLEKIISKHFGKPVTIEADMEEDHSQWSGQVWDDGPLLEILVGVHVEEKND